MKPSDLAVKIEHRFPYNPIEGQLCYLLPDDNVAQPFIYVFAENMWLPFSDTPTPKLDIDDMGSEEEVAVANAVYAKLKGSAIHWKKGRSIGIVSPTERNYS